MKKSIFLFFAAILCAIGMNATNLTGGEVVLLKPSSNWKQANARFAVYFFNDAQGKNTWVSMTKASDETDIYYAVAPTGNWEKLIFCRMNPANNTNDWGNKWNQSGNCTWTNAISLLTVGSSWDSFTGTWSAKAVTSKGKLVASSANVSENEAVTLTPSLTTNTAINTILSTEYTISPATGASVSGNTFTATAAGTYTVTATIKYRLNGYISTSFESTATAEATITVASAAEPKHDVKVTWMGGATELQPSQTLSVGESTEYPVEAPEFKDYTFSGWTLGTGVQSTNETANPISITTKASGDYTLTANYTEIPKVTVYAINSIGWAAVAVHHWHEGGAGTTWPGDVMTKIAEKDPNGFDVYTATFLAEHENCIFNNNNQGSQTATLAVKDGQYYDLKSNTWYASLAEVPAPDPLATDVYLAGEMTTWGTDKIEFKKATADATTATVTVTLAASTPYQFKVIRGSEWTSSKDNRDIQASVSGLVFSKDINDNTKLTTAAAGDYVFTWDINQSQLSIAYPEVTPEYKDITIQVYAKQVPNIWWWNGGDQCPSTEDLVNPSTGNKYKWEEAPAMDKVAGEDNWYTKTFTQVDITKGGIKFKLQSTDHSTSTTNEVVTTEDKCYDARVIATVTETTCGELPSGEVPTVTYNVTVPAGTPACYIAGQMTGWSHQAMTKVDDTHYTITIDGAQKTHEYKYSASNNWDLVELTADGSDMDNRTWTENDVVAQWKVPAAPVPTTYTVAGDSEAAFGTTWAPANTANDMVLEGGLYKWSKTNVALYANTVIKFQVVKNHDWAQGQWPGQNNDWELKDGIIADALYTITITFNESTKEIQATATKTGDIVIKDFSNQPATLYFHPSFHWTSDAAQFAAYFYNNGPGADATPTWVNMTDGDGDGIYEVANAKQHEYVIICRMNPARTENNWDKDKTWNQIEHGITIPNTAGDLNTCLAFWTNCQGDVPTSECTWVVPTPLTDANWSTFVSAYAGKKINAVVERSFKSGQNHTLCLPFDLATNWLGEGAKAYQLSSIVENADELKLKVTTHTTISAGKPYIIVPVKGEEYEHLIVSSVTVKNATAATNSAVGANYQATLKAVTATNGTTNGSTEYYVGANDGCLYNAVVDKLGLRAVIELTTTGGQPLPAKVRAYVATGENEATGFENIVAPEGQTIKAIVNGQLVIIRGGEMYNVQGQVIR